MYADLWGKEDPSAKADLGSIKIDPQFNYIALIDRLAVGDITRHKEIYEMDWEECLYLLLYWNAKDSYTELMNDRMLKSIK